MIGNLERYKPLPNGDPELTPSLYGELCLGNGAHPGIECCCDECDHYQTCFPDLDNLPEVPEELDRKCRQLIKDYFAIEAEQG